jgi:ankyrin repeat protein
MTKNRLITLVILVTLLGWFAWGLFTTARQERFDGQLIGAIIRGDATAVRSLLDEGADPNATEDASRHVSDWQHLSRFFRGMVGLRSTAPAKGKTALILAAGVMDVQPQIVLALLAKGADVHAKDEYGDTALLALIDARQSPYARDIEIIPLENPDLVSAVIDKGADINARDFSGETTLMVAIQWGMTQTANSLIDRGADVNVVAPGCSPGTALNLAIDFGHPDLVKRLIANHADVDLREDSGRSPLQWAEEVKSRPIIRLLKEAGARE